MDENRIKLREAIAFAESQGRKIKKKELAERIFNTPNPTAYNILNNYNRGYFKRLDKEHVKRICEELDVDANFLFDTEPM